MRQHNYEYYTIVIEDTNKQCIVGAGTIMVERKFVHMNGLVSPFRLLLLMKAS